MFNSDFRVGIIGEINYPSKTFDLVLSMDTIYFAKDISSFVGQVYSWLNNNGILVVGYQEGDIMAKTDNSETTVLAKALRESSFSYDIIDYTKQTYDMLRHKRKTIIEFQDDFALESLQDWYSVILNQTNSVVVPYEDYKQHNARYIYIARK